MCVGEESESHELLEQTPQYMFQRYPLIEHSVSEG